SGAAYLWQDGSSNPTFNVLATGQYAVTISLNGCTAADTINVNVASLGSVNLGNDTSLCPGANLLLDATTTGATYLWQNNSNSNTFNVTATGTYSVTVTVGNCTPLNDAIVVSYNTAPLVNLGNDTSLCTGQSLLFDATLAGASYLWQNATVNATLNAISTGNYAVTITDINGCTNNDNINVTFNNPPVVNLGNDTTLCGTQTLLRNVATAGGSYSWQDASANSSYTVTVAGTYYVSVTANNCSSTDTIHVLYNNPPTVFIGNDTTLCPGQTLLLDATTANSVYIWQDNTNTATYTVTAPGTFWVDVTTGTCMPVRDSIIVNYISGSTVFIGNDTTLCPGQTILLDATQAGASYVWQDGTFNPTYSVSNPGTYSVKVTISICTAADTIQVNYYSLPIVNLGADTSICPDDELTLNANNSNSTYQWSNLLITTPTYTVSDSGTVWVNVTNQCGSGSDTIHIGHLICDCKIFVPTAFTPNGDEMNDIFQPKFSCNFIDYKFSIFDRW
ncbi:MAG: hypothetical protein WCI97_13530, partial [Bacteroidota bacterium]